MVRTCTTSSGARLGEYRLLHIAEQCAFIISGAIDIKVFCYTPGINPIHQTAGQRERDARHADGGITLAIGASGDAKISLTNGPAGFFRLFALPS